MRTCGFHACTAFHALNYDINILIKLFYFTTMIFEKEYYCNSITHIFNANSITQVAEGRRIIVLQ